MSFFQTAILKLLRSHFAKISHKVAKSKIFQKFELNRDLQRIPFKMMYNMSMLRHRFSNEWGRGEPPPSLVPYKCVSYQASLENDNPLTLLWLGTSSRTMISLQLATRNWQISTRNWQISTRNWQISTDNWQISTDNSQLTTDRYQLATDKYQLTTRNSQLTDINSQLTNINWQLATDKLVYLDLRWPTVIDDLANGGAPEAFWLICGFYIALQRYILCLLKCKTNIHKMSLRCFTVSLCWIWNRYMAKIFGDLRAKFFRKFWKSKVSGWPWMYLKQIFLVFQILLTS